MPAKAVANPTNKRITTGMYFTTELRLDPISGVTFAETHPTGVCDGSPYFSKSVTVTM